MKPPHHWACVNIQHRVDWRLSLVQSQSQQWWNKLELQLLPNTYFQSLIKTCQLCCFLISGFWLSEAIATRRFHCPLCAFSILWTWSESCPWSAGRWNTEVDVSPIKPGANCSCDLWLGLGGLTKNLHHRLFNDSCGFTVRTYLGLLNQTWNTENR